MFKESEVVNWTVLIVDDEPDSLGVPAGILEFYGVRVHTARDGQCGLRAISSIIPTFVLLDLTMPNLDGWEMLKEIRACSKTENIPVIALTAHAMQGDKERALEAGFDGYITKPIMLDTFLDQIKQCLCKTKHQWSEIPVEEHITE